MCIPSLVIHHCLLVITPAYTITIILFNFIKLATRAKVPDKKSIDRFIEKISWQLAEKPECCVIRFLTEDFCCVKLIYLF